VTERRIVNTAAAGTADPGCEQRQMLVVPGQGRPRPRASRLAADLAPLESGAITRRSSSDSRHALAGRTPSASGKRNSMYTNMPRDIAGYPEMISHGRYAYPANSPTTAMAVTGATIAAASRPGAA